MYIEDARISQGNQLVHFSSIFLALSLVFLGVMQFFKADIGLTSIGSLIRLLGSLVLLVQVFAQGEKRSIF